jgi:predicted DNA-binding transcriptional regulator AlpA
MSALVNTAPQAGGGLLDPLLTTKAVRRDLGAVSDMCLWRWTRKRGFPAPDLVLGNRKYWRRSSIEAWIAEKTRAAREADVSQNDSARSDRPRSALSPARPTRLAGRIMITQSHRNAQWTLSE